MGTGKNVLIGCLRRKLRAASFLPENVPWAADSHGVFELRETRGSISNTPTP